MLQSAFVNSAMHPRSIALPFRIFLTASAAIILSLAAVSVFGQNPRPTPNVAPTPNVSKDAQPTPTPAKPKEEPKPTPAKPKEEPKPTPTKISKEAQKEAQKNPTAEQVSESVILVYAFPGG